MTSSTSSTPLPVTPEPTVAPGDRAIEHGRTFSQLSPQEQDEIINGPRVSAGLVVLTVAIWAAFLAFLIVLARPYMP